MYSRIDRLIQQKRQIERWITKEKNKLAIVGEIEDVRPLSDEERAYYDKHYAALWQFERDLDRVTTAIFLLENPQ